MSFRLNGAIAIVALLITVFCAQLAFGQAVENKRLYAADDDVQDTIIARTGVYDPCCDYVNWADTIKCDNTNSYYTVYLEYRGIPNISHSYYTYELSPNVTYTDDGSNIYVGPSSSNELVMRKDSIGGKGDLENLVMRVHYFDGTPGSPGH